jgi:nucleoside-diphosphate-sugar epimerase
MEALDQDYPRSGSFVEDMGKIEGDLLILGAGGKLGPSLTKLALEALRACNSSSEVIAVSRFSNVQTADDLEEAGARVVRADIESAGGLSSLPEAANIIHLVGAKFGTLGNESSTWFTNSYLPGRVAERFKSARIVALSTGNVYPFSDVGSGGCVETDRPDPVGEYGMSCLGRERIFTNFSEANKTPMAIIRLNYACELRYGVLVDIGAKVLAGTPIDLSMGHVNVVSQTYTNEVILRSLLHANVPPFILNLTGPETRRVRRIAEQFGASFGVAVEYSGHESETALLSDASRCHSLFGYPHESINTLIQRTADWLKSGGSVLGKPTGFQTRDGAF